MTFTKTLEITIIYITVHFKQDLLEESLQSKCFSGGQVLSLETKFASIFHILNLPKSQPSTFHENY